MDIVHGCSGVAYPYLIKEDLFSLSIPDPACRSSLAPDQCLEHSTGLEVESGRETGKWESREVGKRGTGKTCSSLSNEVPWGLQG